MRIKISLLFLIFCYNVQGQNYFEKFNVNKPDSVYLISTFNSSGYYQTGMIISEELLIYSDSTFLYLNATNSSIQVKAYGKYSQYKDLYYFKYQVIKLDTIDQNGEYIDLNRFKLFTELRLINNKDYLIKTSPELIEYTKSMSRFRTYLVHGKKYRHTNRIFLPKRKYFMLIKSMTYKEIIRNASR